MIALAMLWKHRLRAGSGVAHNGPALLATLT